MRNSLGYVKNIGIKIKSNKSITNLDKNNKSEILSSPRNQKERDKSPKKIYKYSEKNLSNEKICRNSMNKYQPPKKRGISIKETNTDEKIQQKDYDLKSPRKRKRKKN